MCSSIVQSHDYSQSLSFLPQMANCLAWPVILHIHPARASSPPRTLHGILMILSPCLILKNAKFLMTGICFVRIAWAEFHHHPTPSLYCLYFSGDNIKSKSALLSGFPCGLAYKESAYNEGDLGLIPGLGRRPGEGKGYPLQYSVLENSMDCIVHGVSKSWTRLSNLHFHKPIAL